MTPTTGKLGKVTVGTTDLCVTSWEVNEEAEDHDTTCTDGTGKNSNLAGSVGCTANVKANFDMDASPFVDPPNIVAGATVILKCYVGDPASNKLWNFPTFNIMTVKNVSEVKGLVTYEFSGKSKGTYTRPS